MSDKAVLVTGACGEIGQALVQKLAERGGYRIITTDLMPLPGRPPGAVRRARAGGSRLSGKAILRLRFRPDLPPGGLALVKGGGGNRGGPSHQRGRDDAAVDDGGLQIRTTGGDGEVHLPQLDRGLWLRRPGRQAGRRVRGRGRLQPAAHDVRLQQALLRETGDLLQPVQRPATPRPRAADDAGFPGDPVPGARSAPSPCPAAGRATTGPRCCTRRRRAAPTPASCARTRASRSWPCPTRSGRC